MKFYFRSMLPVIAFVCFVFQGNAQTSSGTISGHVVDQTDSVIPSAEVKLINQQTAVIVSTTVRPNGDFIFADVQPGTFTVSVQASGYKELRKVNLRLSASQILFGRNVRSADWRGLPSRYRISGDHADPERQL